MHLGSWALIAPPSLWALLPLFIYIVMMFMGKDNVSGLIVGIIVGAVMLGFNFTALSQAFQIALGSSTAMLGLIILTGAGLGVLMNEARVTHTLAYWIVKRIGVTTATMLPRNIRLFSLVIHNRRMVRIPDRVDKRPSRRFPAWGNSCTLASRDSLLMMIRQEAIP